MPRTSKADSTLKEDCQICYDSFETDDKNWKSLNCEHKVCAKCYKEINITRKTMSGISHNSIKCPFCQIVSGTIVGTCPDGTMKVKTLKTRCEGYEDVGSIEIHYFINDSNGYYLNRVAYLPDNDEGREILELLKIAWDRRISFTIGTSITTGAENTVVWNIHHKTNPSGGTAFFGYPDPTYFQRVKWELDAYGIGPELIKG